MKMAILLSEGEKQYNIVEKYAEEKGFMAVRHMRSDARKDDKNIEDLIEILTLLNLGKKAPIQFDAIIFYSTDNYLDTIPDGERYSVTLQGLQLRDKCEKKKKELHIIEMGGDVTCASLGHRYVMHLAFLQLTMDVQHENAARPQEVQQAIIEAARDGIAGGLSLRHIESRMIERGLMSKRE